jgi:hypothetical protein
MSTKTRVMGHCPNCGPERFADVEASHEEHWIEDHASGYARHSILKCRGCEIVYIQLAESCSEDNIQHYDDNGDLHVIYPENYRYWPAPLKREMPKWIYEYEIDNDLLKLIYEMYSAFNKELSVLSAIGVRTVFDRASQLLGVSSYHTFSDKIKNLNERGLIGVDEGDCLEVLIDAGGAAAHRGWRPSPGQLDTMVSALETFLHRSFVLSGALKKLKEEVPSRKKAAGISHSGRD